MNMFMISVLSELVENITESNSTPVDKLCWLRIVIMMVMIFLDVWQTVEFSIVLKNANRVGLKTNRI